MNLVGAHCLLLSTHCFNSALRMLKKVPAKRQFSQNQQTNSTDVTLMLHICHLSLVSTPVKLRLFDFKVVWDICQYKC